MQDLLHHYPAYFPSRNDQLYTLKQFLDNIDNNKYNKYELPIIVNITSSNNYGRCIKNILSKNTRLLLLDIRPLDSILSEYHRSQDGRQSTHKHRSLLSQKKMATKASTTIRNVKKLSKSFASLTTLNQSSNVNDNDYVEDDDDNDNDDDKNISYNRHIVKSLNEKRSSSIPLCRVPLEFRNFFELLNENNQSIEPCHKIGDLMIIEYDDNNPEQHTERWPHAFFLRSSCSAFTKKNEPSTNSLQTTNDQNSNLASSVDSWHSSSSDLESQNNLVTLNDDREILQPGQILTILGDCYAFRERISDKELKEQQQQQQQTPPSPSSSYLSPTIWIRTKSKMLFSKKRRQSFNSDLTSNETISSRSIPGKSELYLKCQTQKDNIVYISLNESGLFSPLNYQAFRLKQNTNLNRMNVSSIFQLEELTSNFRFPIFVRLLDGSISFENNYSPANINPHDSSILTSTKFRLLMPYHERVVFVCPLNSGSSRSLKASLPLIVIPLSVNADIEIQPCSNMNDISKTEAFNKLIETCKQLIDQYNTHISLIHFPLQLTNKKTSRKQTLYKKRSQSTTSLDYYQDYSKYKFRHSDDQLNYIERNNDNASSLRSSPLRYRDSIETVKQKLSTDTTRQQSNIKHSGLYTKNKDDKQKRNTALDNASEDEMYKDVDKIYDYIRSGDFTDDVQKIHAKDQGFNDTYTSTLTIPVPQVSLSISIPKESEEPTSPTGCSPGKMVTHRFSPNTNNLQTQEHNMDYYSSKNDRNVDDDEAHALYLASKQNTKQNKIMKKKHKH